MLIMITFHGPEGAATSALVVDASGPTAFDATAEGAADGAGSGAGGAFFEQLEHAATRRPNAMIVTRDTATSHSTDDPRDV